MNLKHFLTTVSFAALSFSIPVMPSLAENPPLKTGMDVKDTRKVKVNGVKIENFAGTVTIKSVGVGQDVSVSLKGPDDLLGKILVTDDDAGEKGKLYIAFKENAPVLTNVDKIILTLEVPSTTPLDFTLVEGKGIIGQRESNDTKINIKGSGDIKVESVKNLESHIEGSGEITIRKINGDATLAIRADGKYAIEEGTIPHLNASIEGTGVMSIMADVGDADLKSDGAGKMKLRTVTGKLNQSMNGAGSISIDKIEGSLHNKISGSAHFKMDCGKKAKKDL